MGEFTIYFRIPKLLAVVDKRTKQMIKVMDKRRSAEGVIDMSEIIRHWAYDLMVRKWILIREF